MGFKTVDVTIYFDINLNKNYFFDSQRHNIIRLKQKPIGMSFGQFYRSPWSKEEMVEAYNMFLDYFWFSDS